MLDDIVAPHPYATVDEIRAGVPVTLAEKLEAFDDAAISRLGLFASGLMRKATRRATYTTDHNHMPTSTALRTIFRQATLAQITTWLEYDLVQDVFSGGVTVEPTLTASGSNGKSISLNSSTSDSARAHLAGGGLAAEARLILDSVGLLDGFPGVVR